MKPIFCVASFKNDSIVRCEADSAISSALGSDWVLFCLLGAFWGG